MTDLIDQAKPGVAYVTVRAEHPGICLRCYFSFNKGELIRYDWGEGPVHPVCLL